MFPFGKRKNNAGSQARGITNVEKVYNMLTPKPKTLLARHRKLVRHGELVYFSPNTMSKKPRYFFLFNDCLLITKRTGQAKFLLRLWMYLRPGVKLYPMPESPNYEFRLLVPVKGSVRTSKQRRMMIFGKDQENKDAWVNDLAHLLWVAGGKQGPDPSGQGDKIKEEKPEKEEKKEKKEKPKPVEEEKEDEEFDYSSGDEEEEPAHVPTPTTVDPLILFDPFPAGGSNAQPPPGLNSGNAGGAPTDAFGMTPFDPFGLGQASSAQQTTTTTLPSTLNPPSAYYATGLPPGATILTPEGYYITTGADGQPAYVTAGTAPGGYASSSSSGTPLYGQSGTLVGQPGYVYLSGGATAGYDPSVSSPSSSYPSTSLTTAGTAAPGGYASVSTSGTPLYGQPLSSGATATSETGDLNAAVRDTTRAVESLVLTEQVGAGAAGGSNPQQQVIDTNLDRIAQQEMQEATRAIEAITQMLASRPRKTAGKAPEAELTLDHVNDAILDAAQAIAKSASVLLRAAANAQLERVKSDISLAQQNSKPYRADPVWAEGLISASHRVVATTQALVTSADSVIKGEAPNETLVATSHAVTASTAQLLAAQRAKGDITSNVHTDLEAAASGITKATAQLVHATQQLAAQPKSPSPQPQDDKRYSLTEREKEKIERRARVLELEKQAELARKQLEELNREDYKS